MFATSLVVAVGGFKIYQVVDIYQRRIEFYWQRSGDDIQAHGPFNTINESVNSAFSGFDTANLLFIDFKKKARLC